MKQRISLFVPLFALSALLTPMAPIMAQTQSQRVDAVCIKDANTKRETAGKTAENAYGTAMKAARSAYDTAMSAAKRLTDEEARWTAIDKAESDFFEARTTADRAKLTAKQAMYKTQRTELRSCGSKTKAINDCIVKATDAHKTSMKQAQTTFEAARAAAKTAFAKANVDASKLADEKARIAAQRKAEDDKRAMDRKADDDYQALKKVADDKLTAAKTACNK